MSKGCGSKILAFASSCIFYDLFARNLSYFASNIYLLGEPKSCSYKVRGFDPPLLDLGFGDELYSLFKPNFGTKGVGFFKIEATGV